MWPRSAKSVPISAQTRAALGLDAAVAALSPGRADLGDPARAGRPALERRHRHLREGSHQTDADAGDRSNDAVRIYAPELRARVVGRGRQPRAHPGRRGSSTRSAAAWSTPTSSTTRPAWTPPTTRSTSRSCWPGRSPAARSGPRSAASCCTRMTDEVAAHVLRHNDGQNMALAVARYQAPRLLHVHARYLRQLAAAEPGIAGARRAAGEKEIAARRSAGHRADHARARRAARPHQDRRRPAGARLRPARRPALRSSLADYFPAPLRRAVRRPARRAPAAPGDHHHLGDQRDGRHRRVDVPVPAGRGDRAAGARHHPGVAGGQRGLRHAGVLAAGRGAGGHGRRGRADRGRPRGTQAHGTGDQVAAGEPAPAVRHRRDGRASSPRGRRGPVRYPEAALRAGPGRLRGAAHLIHRARACPPTWPTRSRRWCRRTRRSTS